MQEKDKVEQERKELNKKLLKRTFISEYKKNQKFDFWGILIDIVALFIALSLSNFVCEIFNVEFWQLDVLITAILVILLLSLAEFLMGKIRK